MFETERVMGLRDMAEMLKGNRKESVQSSMTFRLSAKCLALIVSQDVTFCGLIHPREYKFKEYSLHVTGDVLNPGT